MNAPAALPLAQGALEDAAVLLVTGHPDEALDALRAAEDYIHTARIRLLVDAPEPLSPLEERALDGDR